MVFNKSGRAPDMKQILADMEARKKAEGQGVSAAVEAAKADKKPYQMVRINVLRDYLVGDLGGRQPLPFERDNERILDDFVFLCFFCGNDFLPHMPTLEIREGAIDLLMTVYRNLLPTMGYLCEGSEVNLERVQVFVKEVAKFESQIFQKRGRMLNNQKSRRRREKAEAAAAQRFQEQQGQQQPAGAPGPRLGQSTQSAADALKQKLAGKHTRFDGAEEANPPKKARTVPDGPAEGEGCDGGGEGAEEQEAAPEEKLKNLQRLKDQLAQVVKDKGDMMDELVAKPDQIRLNEAGFRERYYETKFHVKPGPEQEALARNVVEKYVEGLCWVMKYYYEGCASWKWFYPYHYAPFASDLVDIKDLKIEFQKGEPFKPFEQLMGVLPAASSHALPAAHQAVMKDPNSAIADFYPTDFKIDMNGKRFQWQAVVLLPWIEEKRLLDAARSLEGTLTEDEKRRNSKLTNLLIVSHLHPLAQQIKSLEKTRQEQGLGEARLSEKMDPEKSNHMNGVLELPIGTICPETIHSNYDAMPDVTDNKALTVVYRFPAPHKHLPAILEGTIVPESVVEDRDIPPPAQLWHEDRRRGGRQHVPGLFGVPGAAGSRHGMHLGNNNPGMSPFQGPPPGYGPPGPHYGGNGRGWGPPPGQMGHPGAYPPPQQGYGPPPQQHSYPPPPQQHSYPPPPPQQGYGPPPQQHSYPPPPQGYAPQGYPPQGYQQQPHPGYNPAYLNPSTHGQGGAPPRQPPQFQGNNPYGALQNNRPQ